MSPAGQLHVLDLHKPVAVYAHRVRTTDIQTHLRRFNPSTHVRSYAAICTVTLQRKRLSCRCARSVACRRLEADCSSVKEHDDFLNAPDMVGYSCFHCWSHTKGLMNAGEVVMPEWWSWSYPVAFACGRALMIFSAIWAPPLTVRAARLYFLVWAGLLRSNPATE